MDGPLILITVLLVISAGFGALAAGSLIVNARRSAVRRKALAGKS